MILYLSGKDNYLAEISDTGMDIKPASILNHDNTVKNAGYYHRWFILKGKDAFGLNVYKRGFSDENLFVASTTQVL